MVTILIKMNKTDKKVKPQGVDVRGVSVEALDALSVADVPNEGVRVRTAADEDVRRVRSANIDW